MVKLIRKEAFGIHNKKGVLVQADDMFDYIVSDKGAEIDVYILSNLLRAEDYYGKYYHCCLYYDLKGGLPERYKSIINDLKPINNEIIAATIEAEITGSWRLYISVFMPYESSEEIVVSTIDRIYRHLESIDDGYTMITGLFDSAIDCIEINDYDRRNHIRMYLADRSYTTDVQDDYTKYNGFKDYLTIHYPNT